MPAEGIVQATNPAPTLDPSFAVGREDRGEVSRFCRASLRAGVARLLARSAEDIEIIPPRENFFGVDFGGRTLWGAPPGEFAGMVGDFLIPQEAGGILWHVRWDAGSGSFQTERVAQVGSWEHVTFAPVGFPLFQYTAKFVCGSSAGDAVAPGTYFTAINVHNPTDTEISFRKKFAVALPRERPGPVTRFFDGKLKPDQAMEIDCADIRRRIIESANFTADFLKGFVVIESKVELDVIAVYTAVGATGQVETMHVERVTPRQPGLRAVSTEQEESQ
jgi:hypothetical protein